MENDSLNLDLTFAGLVQKDETESLESYVGLYDKQNKGKKIPQSKMTKKKTSKKSHIGKKVAMLILLMMVTSIASKINVGNSNIYHKLHNSETIQAFDQKYYVGNTSRSICEKGVGFPVDNYKEIIAGLVEGLLEEGYSIDEISICLSKMDISSSKVDDACDSLEIPRATFLGKVSEGYVQATNGDGLVDNMIETIKKGGSR